MSASPCKPAATPAPTPDCPPRLDWPSRLRACLHCPCWVRHPPLPQTRRRACVRPPRRRRPARPGPRRARPGAIPISRATTRTSPSRARPSSGRPNSRAGRFRTSRATSWPILVRERAVEVLLNSPFSGGDPIAGNFGGARRSTTGSKPTRAAGRGSSSIRPTARFRRCRRGPHGVAARAAARAALRRGRGAADSYEDRSLYDRCITRGLPGSMMPANYGNSYRIVQGPGFVAISYEMVHETRVIPLDGRPQVGSAIRGYMGERADTGKATRWSSRRPTSGTTSVYRGANPRRCARRALHAHLPDKVEWSVTVDDPTTWIRPWTFAMPLTRNDKEAISSTPATREIGRWRTC